MLNDVAWRKMPTDILTNENMTYIESQLAPEYAQAPFMFYMAALKKSDDDGIFDLEDGLIFARLMRIKDVSIVFKIANLMGQRRIIGRISETSNICFFTDWEYPNNKVKTWKERREAVLAKIDNSEQLQRLPNFATKAPEVPFSAFECDKIGENVTQNANVTKSAESVTQTAQCDKNTENCHTLKREREKEREIRETHTQREREFEREREKEASASAESFIDSAPAPAEQTKKELSQSKEKDLSAQTPCDVSSNNLAEVALNSQKVDETKREGEISKKDDISAVKNVLIAFFEQNGVAFDSGKSKTVLNNLSKSIKELSNDDYTPEDVAKICCKEFKKMHDTKGVWENIPISPVYMAKEGVWAHLLEYVAKRLRQKKKSSNLPEKKNLEECSKTVDFIDAEYKKYGIDKDDPMAIKKLKDAREKEKQQVSEPDYKGDIF